ncbi:MAG: prepilin-type N-terminal cleavage/methylation domain-containing protein [Pseudomonadota bacterium]|nr:prepilin-type N-terminal cleavage/methylation domain-containing protein [Pseudomonadota bacterium]
MRTAQQGLTLVELVVVIVILGIALAIVAPLIANGSGRSARVLLETQAVALAQSYMDEILSKRFADAASPSGIPPYVGPCALVTEETLRADFDDVDDFEGLSEGFGTPDPLRDVDGNARAGYENFRVDVTVRCLDSEVAWVDAQANGKFISVTVSHSTNTQGWKFGAYKANF